jgi:amino acid transporter
MKNKKIKKLRLISLVGIIYCTVSGGAFGMEDIIAGGPGIALALLIITPLVYSMPIALISAELGAMMPFEGGYYRWVYFAMGPFWGFQMSWWRWIGSFFDMAIYPLLFTTFMRFFIPSLSEWQQFFVSLLVIVSSLLVNLNGAWSVGQSAVLSTVVVNLPFLLLVFIGLPKITIWPWHPFFINDGSKLGEVIGLCLSVSIWSYSGWDSVSTFAGEVENPSRTLPLSVLISVPLVTLMYLLPIGVALGGSHWYEWNRENYPISSVAGEIVGPWLGSMISLVGMASCWSLFNSWLLSYSRLPFAMAEDGMMPKFLAKIHHRWGTPYTALGLCTAIYTFFSLLGFKALVIMDALIIVISSLLNLIALVLLRLKKPDINRPFKLPGGWFGVGLASVSLATCLTLLIYFTIKGGGDSWKQVVITGIFLSTGPFIFFLRHKSYKPKVMEEKKWIQNLQQAERKKSA